MFTEKSAAMSFQPTNELMSKQPLHQVMEGSGSSGQIAAYFDLDGTLLDASSEKTLTGTLTKRRPWRIPIAATAWTLRALGSLLIGKSWYDSARNRGHFTAVQWDYLAELSEELVHSTLSPRIPKQAHERLDWHREQGHRLVLVTATVAPMAEAMGAALKMDTIYGCGPEKSLRTGRMSGSEKGWSVPRRKGKSPIVKGDAERNGHDLSKCYGYGNTHADSWFMRICGNPIAVNPEPALKKHAEEHNWECVEWKI